ncbi:MAG: hypothetical protein LBT00_11705 [Spirochaetaceae bacterium]|nr:hypothetical protein [Spirochaetaceae bacterium]
MLRCARNDMGTVVIARSKATKQSRRKRPSQAQREALSRLLRFARNDGRNWPSLRGAKRRSNPDGEGPPKING